MRYLIQFAGFVLLVGLSFSFRPVLAQTEKGVGWWSASGGWQKNRTDLFQNVDEQNTLNLSLTQGTFLRNNLLVGAELRLTRFRNLNRQGFNFDAVSDSRETSFSATPFVRRFWGKEALRGYVGGGVSVGYGFGRLLTTNTLQRISEQESTQWRLSPEFQAGLFYAIDTRWGLELSARSGLFPISFANLNLGLVVLTGVAQKQTVSISTPTPQQLLTGNWLLGGTFELGSTQQQLTSGSDKLTTIQRQGTKQFAISPSIGYMPGNRWVVGVSVPVRREHVTNEFNRTSSSSPQVGTVLTNSIGVEPFAKKYLSKNQLTPYLAGRVGWRQESTSGDGAVQSQGSGYNWRLTGGLAYLLSTNFIVEGEIGGFGSDWSRVEQTGDAHSNTALSFSLRPALTLTYVVW